MSTAVLHDALAMPVDTIDGALRAQRGDVRLRRAALMLHALAPDDRDWLLAQLPPGRREPLADLLDELAQLGIPASAALAGDPGEPPAAPAPAPEDRLAGVDARALAEVLEREPADLTARVLGLRDWPWQGALLARLSPGRRRQVQAALAAAAEASAPRHAPALEGHLLSLLDERLHVIARARAARGAGRRPLAWLARLRTGARDGLSTISTKAKQ